MSQRALVGGLLVTLIAGGTGIAGAGSEAQQPASISTILNMNQSRGSIDSWEKAFSESIKREALAPAKSAGDWELQPDGAMKNKRTGISLIVRNPCPPGDAEHELALAAYNEQLAKARRR
jgi:hypothetical protein